jgi:hypothetical protein
LPRCLRPQAITSNAVAVPMRKQSLVNCTGNPRVLLRVPGPGPAENPYPSKGYRFFHGYASSNPRVYPYPYPQWVFTGTG